MEPSKDRQPSIKRKALPPIRQTRTSAYRILKANPLMMHDKETVAKMGISDTNNIPKSVDVLGISLKHKELTNLPAHHINNTNATKKPHILNYNDNIGKRKDLNNDLDKKRAQNYLHRKNLTKSEICTNGDKKNKIDIKSIKYKIPMEEPVRQSISKMYRDRQKSSRRRSRSAESFNPSKCFKKSIYEEACKKLETSLSMDKLPQKQSFKQPQSSSSNSNLLINEIDYVSYNQQNHLKSSKNCFKHVPEIESLENSNSNEKNLKQVALDINMSPIRKVQPEFKTPNAYNRRSVAQCTPSTGRKSIYKLHSSTPAPGDLQKRLNEWLKKRGKSLGSFHHLNCFGLSRNNVEHIQEYKENNKNKNNTDKNSSGKHELFKYTENNDVEVTMEPEGHIDFAYIAKDALDDLHKLIQDGYPTDQCEAWLGRIRQKYEELEEEPLYWECRAAIEQWKGNISSAVEHYRKAIVKGAEVHTVEESLDQLLQKFSLLNINPDIREEDMTTTKINLDVKNAFKSTIIQFAVQERMLKKKEEDTTKKIIVRPVRRSTRLSMKHAGSSHIKLCASLKEIEMDENTKFQSNSYLSIRFSP